MIIGFTGYAGSGKDTAAKCFIDRGYKRVSFAAGVKDLAYAINPWVLLEEDTSSFAKLQAIVDRFGWDFAKREFDDVRRLLQRIGTEGGRDVLGKNIWIDTALNNAPENAVVTDVRFLNEAKAIWDREGVVIRLMRDNSGLSSVHSSETELDLIRPDFVVENNGTVEELHEQLLGLDLKSLVWQRVI